VKAAGAPDGFGAQKAATAARAGATLYVTPGGSDATVCNIGNPCRTLGRAVTLAGACEAGAARVRRRWLRSGE
jgi:hypothetical protein